ncbi:MAG: ABC transporter ATP-binding protein [Lachnospiraceae bacterium]|nr:ABC transporter ATP-binding protein [Lachnospiraceae bacterium]
MIEVTHLTKRYGSNAAVDDLSFTVEKGQIYGFLGPNGAGKSTTMNILTGYIAPTSGEVVIDGHNILEEPEEARKCIGYLPEIPPVYPDMTVLEYLQFAAELKKIPKNEREQMILEVMQTTGLMEMQGRLIRNLSKGYRQRTGLAQAVLGYPDIIILDEPMVGLDPKQIIEIRELIKSLGQKHTVILSSHILSEISAICDHIMIIAHGKLVASDTPDNLMKLMRGSGSLELTIRGREADTRKMLSSLPGVDSLDVKVSAEAGACDVVIKTEADNDLREMIFYMCAQEKKAILRMQHTHVSLEDIFLELTEDHPAEQKPKKKRRFGFGGKSAKQDADDDESSADSNENMDAIAGTGYGDAEGGADMEDAAVTDRSGNTAGSGYGTAGTPGLKNHSGAANPQEGEE